LGTDERVFKNIDLTEFKPVFIKWIKPQTNESIESYATRLLCQIKDPNPILIGLSFGGIMAIEVAKQIETHKIIIISSAKDKTEIPFYYRMAGRSNIHNLVPLRLLKNSNGLTNWFFGTTSPEECELLREITNNTDSKFVKWAVDKIVKWTNTQVPKNLYHIHGTKDRLLPLKESRYDKPIPGGGHLMILNKAEQLTKIIKERIMN
jgi:pimeloyl-ACP methyl ester carboxylesterase